MAYQFKKPKSSNKPIHIVLTALVAVLAVAVLAAWLWIGYLQNRPTEQPETTEKTGTVTETVTEPATCLVILSMEDNRQYLLIQTQPEEQRLLIASVPAALDIGTDDTLTDVLSRSGPAKVTELVAEQLELPINNYIYLTASGVNKFVNEMENGVTIELPESVSYTDENGIKSTLSAGKTTLTAGQTTAVLAHSKWKSSENAASVATSITASLFNGYMTTDHSLKGYFGVLSNVAQTNLRIDNYTAYASALNHLAECNTGDVAAIVQLDGETENGLFIPDVDACRHNSGFYHE